MAYCNANKQEMQKLLFLAILLFPLCLFSQYQIGHSSFSFDDPARNNRNVYGEVYYPADIAGDNVSVSMGEFPVIVFGHGFVVSACVFAIFDKNVLISFGLLQI